MSGCAPTFTKPNGRMNGMSLPLEMQLSPFAKQHHRLELYLFCVDTKHCVCPLALRVGLAWLVRVFVRRGGSVYMVRVCHGVRCRWRMRRLWEEREVNVEGLAWSHFSNKLKNQAFAGPCELVLDNCRELLGHCLVGVHGHKSLTTVIANTNRYNLIYGGVLNMCLQQILSTLWTRAAQTRISQ